MTHTSARVWQWVGIIAILCLFGGAYWYFQVYGSTLNKSPTGSITSGLIGYWTFDGADISGTTATDRSGSGNNGTLTNTPTQIPGKVGQALSFDGSNDYVALGSFASTAKSYTFAFWVKRDSGSSGYYYIFDSLGGRLTIDLGANAPTAGAISFNDGSWKSIGPVVPADEWHYVALTFNNSSLIATGYIDGVSVGTAVYAGNINLGATTNIGSSYFPDTNFQGSLDDFRIYSRVLVGSEIQSLYDLGNSDKVNTSISQPQGTGRLDSGLAGYWPLDDGSGTSATDSSTNGATGTLNNFPASPWTTGQIGGGLTIDGTDDYITAGTGTQTQLTSVLSLSAWVYISSLPANGEVRVIARKYAAADASILYEWGISNTGSNTFLFFRPGSGGNYNYDTKALSTGQWYHFTITFNKPDITFYVNGALTSTTSDAVGGGFNSGSGTFRMGGIGTSATTLNGKLDEVRVYNRVLSAGEVGQLYRLASPTAVDTGLKGYWSFNAQDVSGTSAYDRSGAGNTGTLTNGPAVTEGKVGQAVSFDGSNDYMIKSGLDLSGTNKVSVAGWLWQSSFRTDDGLAWEQTTNTGSFTTGFYFDPNTSSGYLSVTLVGNVGSNSATYTRPSASEWHHYVAIYDKSQTTNEVDLYIDGVLQTAVSRSATSNNTNNFGNDDWYVMNRSSNQLPNAGKLDELRVYNRVLSAGEIKALYDAGQSDPVNSSTSQAQGTGRADSGLGGYWRLDDGTSGATPTSAADASTNGYTGTLTNGPTWTTGQIGNAVTFDGTDDYIDTDNGSAIDSLVELTYSAWIYPTSGDGFILGKRTNGGGTEGFKLTSSTLQGWVANFIGASSGRATSSTTVSLNTWSFVTMTYNKNGDNKPHLYINGAEVTYSEQDTLSGSDADDQYDFWIGRMQANGELSDVPYTGKIDEVRVYNRALSANEVARLYRLTSPTGTETSLKGYWSFNGKDLSGTTAYDRSGAGNTGTLTNGPAIAEGKIGQALSFDGTDDYVAGGTDSSWDSLFSSGITISAWVKFPSFSTFQRVVTIPNTAGVYDTWLQVNQTTGLAQIGAGGSGKYKTGTTAFSTNTWYHIVGVTNYTDVGTKVYVNGVDDGGTVNTTLSYTADRNALHIGRLETSYATGSIDEVRIYNRALTAAEVASLYNSGL